MTSHPGASGAFTFRIVSLFIGLYAAQAITGSLVQTGLPTVLREEGMGLDRIGLLSLLFLPWALKFLWAPLVDRFCVARLGRRRSWLLLCQSLIVASFLVLSQVSPADHFELMLCVLLAVAVFAATQDIATDALAVEAVDESRRATVSSAGVFGGYVGFLLGVGAWLPVYAAFGWQASMLFMAGVVAVLTIPAVAARGIEAGAPVPVAAGLSRPRLSASFRRMEYRRGLGFMLVYQSGLRLGIALIGPFLVDAGLTLAEIGWLKGAGGAADGLAAALAMMAVLRRPSARALMLAALANATLFLALAGVWSGIVPKDLVAPLILAQSAAAATSMIALYAVMIGWCSPLQAGTDFALLQSADAVMAIAFGIAAGFIGQTFGHAAVFALAAVLLLVGAGLARRLSIASEPPLSVDGALEIQGNQQ